MSIQSMLSAPASDFDANLRQAEALREAGCEIIRVAVPDKNAVPLISLLKERAGMPVVADIHFDYRLAIESAAAGADKIRINPGNIGDESRVKAVADECRRRGIPIRIGVNSGSLERGILAKYGAPAAEALVESALQNAAMLERWDFEDIVISIKSSDVPRMFEAYRRMYEQSDYPLHLGVTEAGTERMGLIKSSAGIGGLLLLGIGDTLRVSLTDDPVLEIRAARDILRAVGLRQDGVTIISCPTCGRTSFDLISLAKEAERRLRDCKKNIRVAIMGCVVNGPGEAKDADIGIAGGKDGGLLMKKGQILRRVPKERLLDELMEEIEKL